METQCTGYDCSRQKTMTTLPRNVVMKMDGTVRYLTSVIMTLHEISKMIRLELSNAGFCDTAFIIS